MHRPLTRGRVAERDDHVLAAQGLRKASGGEGERSSDSKRFGRGGRDAGRDAATRVGTRWNRRYARGSHLQMREVERRQLLRGSEGRGGRGVRRWRARTLAAMRLEPDVPPRDRRDALGNAPPRTTRATRGLARARTRTSYCLTPARLDASCVAIPSVIHAACPPMATGVRPPRELTVFLVPGDAKPSRSRARVTPSTDPTPPFAIEPMRADTSSTRSPFGPSRTASCAAREACDGPRRGPFDFASLQPGGCSIRKISHTIAKMRIKSDADSPTGRVEDARRPCSEHLVSLFYSDQSFQTAPPSEEIRATFDGVGTRGPRFTLENVERSKIFRAAAERRCGRRTGASGSPALSLRALRRTRVGRAHSSRGFPRIVPDRPSRWSRRAALGASPWGCPPRSPRTRARAARRS